jgi:hypothetical protein
MTAKIVTSTGAPYTAEQFARFREHVGEGLADFMAMHRTGGFIMAADGQLWERAAESGAGAAAR